MTDDEWLYNMFVIPERDLLSLPEWARPVVTPPSDNGDYSTPPLTDK